MSAETSPNHSRKRGAPFYLASIGPKRLRKQYKSTTFHHLVPPQRNNILPLGNAYFSNLSECRTSGLGTMNMLPDDLLVTLLSHLYLDATSLCRLSQASQAWYAFTRSDELWRSMYVKEFAGSGGLKFNTSWRRTFAEKWAAIHNASRQHDVVKERQLKLRGMYSGKSPELRPLSL